MGVLFQNNISIQSNSKSIEASIASNKCIMNNMNQRIEKYSEVEEKKPQIFNETEQTEIEEKRNSKETEQKYRKYCIKERNGKSKYSELINLSVKTEKSEENQKNLKTYESPISPPQTNESWSSEDADDSLESEPTSNDNYIFKSESQNEINEWEYYDYLVNKKTVNKLPDLSTFNENLVKNRIKSYPCIVPTNSKEKRENEYIDKRALSDNDSSSEEEEIIYLSDTNSKRQSNDFSESGPILKMLMETSK